jgi:hypothetical protein
MYMAAMRYAINTNHVASRTLDDGAVLIHYETGYYYSLNGTATFLWSLLSERELTFEELAAALSQHYSLSHDVVIPDLRKHLEELTAENLLIAR